MRSTDTPRKTFSAPQRYWDLLESIVADGHAKNISAALRYVCDEHLRTRQRQELVDAAHRLDNNDWMTLSGLQPDAGDGTTPKWSQLHSDNPA